jgi:hypothetical protein
MSKVYAVKDASGKYVNPATRHEAVIQAAAPRPAATTQSSQVTYLTAKEKLDLGLISDEEYRRQTYQQPYGQVTYVDIETGKPKPSAQELLRTPTKDLLLTSAIEKAQVKRTEPEIRALKQTIAVREGTLLPGRTYTETEEMFALRSAEEKIKERRQAYNLEMESLKGMYRSELDFLQQEQPKLERDWRTFEDKYKSYYDPEQKKYINLPESAESEMDVLNQRTKEVNEKIGFVEPYYKKASQYPSEFDMLFELETKRQKLGALKMREYNYLMSIDSTQYASGTEVFELGEKRREKIREISELYNIDAGMEYKDYGTQNPFKEIKIPFISGDEKSGFFSTGMQNIVKTGKLYSLGFLGSGVGEKVTDLSYGVNRIANEVADFGRERNIEKIELYKARGASDKDIMKLQIRALREEKYTRAVGGAARWVGRYPVESIYLGAALTTPIGLKYAVPAIAVGGVAITSAESLAVKYGATTESVDVAFQMGELEIQKRIKKGTYQEDIYYEDKPVKGFVREWLPGGALAFGNVEKYTEGAISDLSYDQGRTVAPYFQYRTLGARQGGYVGAILGEMSGELAGRKFTQSFAKNIAPDLIKSKSASQVFWQTAKKTAPQIARAAPAEVAASYTLAQMSQYKEVEPGIIVGGSLIASPPAGAIGGTIAGGYMAGRVTIGTYSRLGTVTNVLANVADIAELPGDAYTDVMQYGVRRAVVTPNIEAFYTSYRVNMPGVMKESDYTGTIFNAEIIAPINLRQRDGVITQTPEKTIVPAATQSIIKDRVTSTKSDTYMPLPTEIKIKEQIKTDVAMKVDISTQETVQIPESIRMKEEIKETLKEPIKENVRVNVPVTVPDKLFLPILPIGFPFGFGGLGKKGRGMRRDEYAPDLIAILSGKTTRTKPSRAVYSGQEIRPIYVGKNGSAKTRTKQSQGQTGIKPTI